MTINLTVPSIMISAFKSWKTTLVGVAAGVLAIVQGFQTNDISALVHNPVFQMKVLVFILGLIAKDGNVTGGTVGQPSTPEALKVANQAPSTENPPAPNK